MNLARSTFKKSGAIEGVRILLLQAGSDNVAIENFSIASSSGSEYRSGKMYGIQNVLFPLDVKVRSIGPGTKCVPARLKLYLNLQ